jgi:drug/metabolite transporter (DMT)-like permease
MSAMPPRPQASPATLLALTVAVVAFSSSGPLIAYAAAPGLAIAFWRNALAVGVLAPTAGVRHRSELLDLVVGQRRREGLYCVLAGAALAVHFGLWVPSIKLTTVAMSTALVASQPVWQGLIAVGQGRHLPRLTWLGISVAVVGVALATGVDIGVSPTVVAGDLMALVGGAAAAVYTALGERTRTVISTASYTSVCYGVCAALLLVACVVLGTPLGGYPPTTWLALVGLTVGPQLFGHTMANFALRRVSATTISVLILLEVPGAAVLSWLWLGQVPRAQALPGLVTLVVGVAIVLVSRRRATVSEPVPAVVE